MVSFCVESEISSSAVEGKCSMCGIAGFVEFKSPKLGLNDLLAMRRAIQHRGPDDEGFFLKPKVGLAHARLAILDLSPSAHQPMHRGHLTIVYNGEVYNFKELRHDLEKEGHQFQSRSDTEVVLASYQRWGKDALSRLNGMFAFAIYDHERNQLFLARDRFGIKPLFYYVDENCLLFASEIKAFYQYHRFRKELCMEAVRTYLHFGYMQGKKTVWKRCFRILPSECILVDIEKKKLSQIATGFHEFSRNSNTHIFRILLKPFTKPLSKNFITPWPVMWM